jgi:seryl-tRNA synthetase
MFHQHELVRVDEPDVVREWRDEWAERGLGLLQRLGLDVRLEVASDPFFGRRGRMLAATQRQQAMKLELLVHIAGPSPTALASFNYHRDHFCLTFGIHTAGGAVAHSACAGFGHERIVLALLAAHGRDPVAWPAEVREQLWR